MLGSLNRLAIAGRYEECKNVLRYCFKNISANKNAIYQDSTNNPDTTNHKKNVYSEDNYEKLIQLYAFHVLPPLNEWSEAESFLKQQTASSDGSSSNNTIVALPQWKLDAFLSHLAQLKRKAREEAEMLRAKERTSPTSESSSSLSANAPHAGGLDTNEEPRPQSNNNNSSSSTNRNNNNYGRNEQQKQAQQPTSQQQQVQPATEKTTSSTSKQLYSKKLGTTSLLLATVRDIWQRYKLIWIVVSALTFLFWFVRRTRQAVTGRAAGTVVRRSRVAQQQQRRGASFWQNITQLLSSLSYTGGPARQL